MASAKKRYIYRWDEVPLIVDIPFLADMFGLSRETIRKSCSTGEIKAIKMCDQWRISKEEVMRLYNKGTGA